MLAFTGLRELLPYFPAAPLGHILITSRDRVAWQGVTQAYVVEVFERRESVLFLCQRTQQTDEQAASALADVLGDLPLGLAQAAAYIDALGISMDDYLHLFQSQRQALWQAERAPFSYDKTVKTTWQLSLEELQNESPASADLLNLCAYFAPDDISLSLLHEGSGTLPQPLAVVMAHVRQLNRLVAILRRYALIQKHHDDTFSIHRLVQAVTRDQLSDKDNEYWIDIAIQLFADIFLRLEAQPTSGDMLTHVLPHTLVVVEHAQNLPESRVSASLELLLYVKLVPKIVAFYGYGSPKVQQIYQRAKRICEVNHVPPELEYRVEYWTATYFHLHGEHMKNEVLCQKLTYLSEKANDDGLRLETSMLYGITYWALGKFYHAQKALEKGIALYNPKVHHNHTNDFAQDPYLAMMNYLSHVLWLMGFAEKSLMINDEKIIYSKEIHHPENKAFAYHSSAALYLYRREPEKARFYADRSLFFADKYHLIHWQVSSMMIRCWARYRLHGKTEDLVQLRQNVMVWQSKMNSMLALPFLLATLSEI
jgi:tetratricopeptide (TPR) repeat protein